MNLIVWNSQGNKWDIFWNSYINPLLAGPAAEDVVGLLVESGWAPWVASGNVQINALYWREDSATWYDANSANASPFCQGVAATRQRYAIWVPWVGNLDAFKTNTRCSLGGVFLPKQPRRIGKITTFAFNWMRRPVVRFDIGIGAEKGLDIELTVLLVHLLSGNPARAQAEMDYLITNMSGLIPHDTAGMIVGDININLLNINLQLPRHWSFLRTNVATQQSGGELDYALLYDPTNSYGAATAAVVQAFKTGANGSDHSVMQYSIPL